MLVDLEDTSVELEALFGTYAGGLRLPVVFKDISVERRALVDT